MYAKKKSVSTKVVVLLLAVVLLIGCVAGGTIAYLMTNTDPVTNTFVAGEIGTLTLTETYNTDSDQDGTPDKWTAIVTPGVNLSKNPEVKLVDNNVDAYVFVKLGYGDGQHCGAVDDQGVITIQHYGTDDNKIYWTLDDGWKRIDGAFGVYYREVSANNTDSWGIIKDDTVYVSSTLTEAELANFALDLSFTAYAIQQADGGTDNNGEFTPAEAWNQIKTDLNIQ